MECKTLIAPEYQRNVFQDKIDNKNKNTKFGQCLQQCLQEWKSDSKRPQLQHSNYTKDINTTKHMEIHLPVPALQFIFYPKESRVMKFITWKDESENQMSFFPITTL